MILFDWKKVYKVSGGKATKILQIVEYITYKPVPKNMKDPIARLVGIKWDGTSYLYNPKPLFTEIYYTPKERAQYIGVASRRKLSDLLLLGITTLELAHCPLSYNAIKDNRLLSVEDNKIYFKWEEYARRK